MIHWQGEDLDIDGCPNDFFRNASETFGLDGNQNRGRRKCFAQKCVEAGHRIKKLITGEVKFVCIYLG